MNGSFWGLLDEPSRYRLLVSGHGKQHLLETAGRLLSLAGGKGDKGQLLDIGVDMMLAAWEDSPLDGQLATNLLNIDSRIKFLPSVYRDVMGFVATNYLPPENMAYFQRLALEKDSEKLISYLGDQVKRDPENLFWAGHFLDISLFGGNYDVLDYLAELEWPDFMKQVSNKYKGDFLFCMGATEKSVEVWSDAEGKTIPGQTILRMANALYRSGRVDEARILWRERMNSRPWQVNTWLCAYEMMLKENSGKSTLDGNVALCLYTYNKASDLEHTFEALADSELENVRVVALNNGCTDESSSVLSSWKDRLGDKLRIIDLPVNIGAPAARNWLKHHSDISCCDYVAYLDDDALVPQDWQSAMADAVEAYPDAGVWGCKVVEHGRDEIIQHADIHLREPADSLDDPLRGFDFSYFESFNQDMDYGQYDYCRPCVSVTGCFHVFRREVLEVSTDFDLRYSPSQYDDFDHDISLGLAGHGAAVYQGMLKVRHRRRTGAGVKLDRATRGAGAGNVLKLEAKYSSTEIRSIIKKDVELLEADFSEKALKLASFLDNGD